MSKKISSIFFTTLTALTLSTQMLASVELPYQDDERLEVAEADYLTKNTFQVAEAIGNGVVQLADLSLWRVKSREIPKVQKWTTTDLLVITQNFYSSYFSNEAYPFCIRNESNGDSVPASLGFAPNRDRAPMILIIESDNRHIHLTDGSKWKVSFYDDNIVSGSSYTSLRKWSPQDQIILGVNKESVYYGSEDIILINATLNGSFVRAKRIY